MFEHFNLTAVFEMSWHMYCMSDVCYTCHTSPGCHIRTFVCLYRITCTSTSGAELELC